MRKLLFIWLSVFIVNEALSRDNKYESTMTNAIEALYAHQTMEDLLEVSARFERISQVENDKWLPSYYAALSKLWMTHQTSNGEDIDKFLDQAQKDLDHCRSLSEDDDEIHTLQGYLYMMRITVDPANRGAKYSPMSLTEFQKARSINPENPRALLMMGQMKYGADEFFGNDLTEACNMIKGAAEMLEEENPRDKLDPSWGKRMANYLAKSCE